MHDDCDWSAPAGGTRLPWTTAYTEEADVTALRTVVLRGTLTVLFAFIGVILGGRHGMVTALVLVALLNALWGQWMGAGMAYHVG
jgi:hypothetical protein